MDLSEVAALVFMGGAGDVNQPTDWMKQELELIRRAADRGIPILGICLGAQLISKALGGEIRRGETVEAGWHPVEPTAAALAQGWFTDLPSRFEVFQWHAHGFSIPPGAIALARGACAEHQAFAIDNILAMQFHLEMMPKSIRGLIARYASDLEDTSDCVQSAEKITANLAERTARLHKIADLVYGRWVGTF